MKLTGTIQVRRQYQSGDHELHRALGLRSARQLHGLVVVVRVHEAPRMRMLTIALNQVLTGVGLIGNGRNDTSSSSCRFNCITTESALARRRKIA